MKFSTDLLIDLKLAFYGFVAWPKSTKKCLLVACATAEINDVLFEN
jgi:hypothetical protein